MLPPRTPGSTRRQWLALHLGAGALGLWPAAAPALPARPLQFPRDHGSHPDLRTEWWYITGHAQAAGRLWGFQVTFFRSRVDSTQELRSAFAARQLLFAHAALTDVQGQRLHHDQRIARAGFGVAQASEADTAVRLHDWSLARTDLPGAGPAGSRYTARIEGSHFGLDLHCDTTQPLVRQGVAGLSRKGPEAAQASYYYSQPQLAVGGSIVLQGQRMAIDTAQARAWLDHEWSEALLHPEAVGWDWIGMNLDDGSALTAFRLRRADGTALWAGGVVSCPGPGGAGVCCRCRDLHRPALVDQPAQRCALPGAVAGTHPGGAFPGARGAGRPGARQQRLDRRHLLGGPVRAAGPRRATCGPGIPGNDGIQKAAAPVRAAAA